METDRLKPFLFQKAKPSMEFETSSDALKPVLDAVTAVFSQTETAYETNKENAQNQNRSRFTERLFAAAHGYRAVLYAYLTEKEKIILPTLRAFFTPEEVFGLFAEILKQTPKLAFGSVVHHLAGGEEAVKAFNARSVVSSLWRFTSNETIKNRSEYRLKVESKLERVLLGDPHAKLSKNKADFVNVNALKPLELNERLVVTPSSSSQLAEVIANELAGGGNTGVGVGKGAEGSTGQTEGRQVDLAVGA